MLFSPVAEPDQYLHAVRQTRIHSHDRVEPDQTPRVRLERGGDSVHRNLDVHPALTQLDGRCQSSSQWSIFGDVDLAKFEVSLLFEVELVNVPGARRSVSHSDLSGSDRPAAYSQ